MHPHCVFLSFSTLILTLTISNTKITPGHTCWQLHHDSILVCIELHQTTFELDKTFQSAPKLQHEWADMSPRWAHHALEHKYNYAIPEYSYNECIFSNALPRHSTALLEECLCMAFEHQANGVIMKDIKFSEWLHLSFKLATFLLWGYSKNFICTGR